MFNSNIPSKINNALTDLIAIATNFLELRQNERSTAAPSNPVTGQLWVKKDDPATGKDTFYQRNPANTDWIKLWSTEESDVPGSKLIKLTSNILAAAGVTVDGRDLSVDGAKLDTYGGSGIGFGVFNGVQKFTASGTFNVPAGVTKVLVEMIGGGGGGGGSSTNGGDVGGGGGGGGGFAKSILTITGSSVIVTVGAGGTAGAAGNNPGGAGGNSSFGGYLTAYGGSGGAGNMTAGGGAGGAASGTLGRAGQAGGNGASGVGGTGGTSNAIGDLAGLGYGSGGAGAQGSSSIILPGNAGTAGAILVWY